MSSRSFLVALLLAAPPALASEERITVPSADRDVSLAAVLALPEQPAKHAVLLLPVAGPTDCDMSLGPRGLYRAIADRLAADGIASLRIADRGVDGSGGDWLQTDLEMRSTDARSALEWLRRQPPLAGARLGALGMSEGGAIALRLAAAGAVDFVVALSTPMEDGVDTLRGQRNRLLESSQLTPEQRSLVRSESDRFLDALLAADVATVREILRGEVGSLILPPYGFVPRDTEGRIEFVLTPWYRSQVTYRAGGDAERIRVPVFAAYGALDQVIDSGRSVQLLRDARGSGRR